MRQYNVKRNPDDQEIKIKADEITRSYLIVMEDLGIEEKKRQKISRHYSS